MKKFLLFFVLGNLILWSACGGTQKSVETTPESVNTAPAEMVNIMAVISGAEGTLGVFRFDGIGFKPIQELQAVQGDTFQFQLPKGEPDVYYLGKAGQQMRPIVVGPEDNIQLFGGIKTIRQSVFKVSALNQQYDDVIAKIAANKRDMQSIERQMRMAGNNPQQLETLKKRILDIDIRKKQQVTDLQQKNTFLAKIAELDNFQSYASDPRDHPDVLHHYVNEFFSGANLADPVYNSITYVFEAFREYATTLASVGLPEAKVMEAFDGQLNKIPVESQTYKYALGGITLALQQKNHPLFVEYAGRFYEKYKSEGQPHTLALGRQINSAQSLMTGAVAPDFTQNTPEGKAMKLSDLRGKVVLLDFWASWCGPCRRENPHVVKLYEKYKDQGFDILGVSLDNSKAKWMDAIEKDKLTWHHVSDLKGWKNAAAASYAVRSIPSTFLLDKDGQIIARNLRGAQLDQRLEEIFGF